MAQPATYNAMANRGYSDYPPGAGIAGFGASEAITRDPTGGRTPYGAFTVPGGPAPGDPFSAGGPYPMQGSRNGRDVFDAGGVGVAGAAGVGATYLNRGPSQNAGSMLARGPSNSASRSLSLTMHREVEDRAQTDTNRMQHTIKRPSNPNSTSIFLSRPIVSTLLIVASHLRWRMSQ